MNFKPNYDLEERIISDIMHDSSLLESYTIKPEWFNVLNFKALLISITNLPEVTEYIEWLGEAKKYGFKGDFKEFKHAYDDFMAIDDFKRLITTLKREYLNNLFNSEILEAQNNPTADNQSQCMDTLAKIKHIGMESNDGDLNDTTNEIIDSLYHPRPLGISIANAPRFNQIFGGGMNAGLHIIGAGTGVGKTSFAINMICDLYDNPDNQDVICDLFSGEMDIKENMLRIISCLTGVNSYNLLDPYHRIKNPTVRKYVQQTAEKINDSNLHIYDQKHNLSDIIDTMKNNASMLKNGSYKYIAIIDYLGLVNVDDVEKRYLALGKITRELKNFSNDYKAPVFALAQLNRNAENREDKTPRLSDIRESSNIAQDSNTTLLLQKSPDSDDDNNILDLHIAKNRNGEQGIIKFAFDGKRMKIKELDTNE